MSIFDIVTDKNVKAIIKAIDGLATCVFIVGVMIFCAIIYNALLN